ncbi:MAG: hypothetical protein H6713_20085 [Myxococcales bacterium]|nr:hypothetical protein [Myxococcales bacterium]
MRARRAPPRRWSVRATRALALALTGGVLLAPARARACKCGAPLDAVVTRPVVVGDGAPLRAGADTATLTCRGVRTIRCAWRSEHVFRNTGDAPAPVVFALALSRVDALTVTVNGVAATLVDATGETRARLEALAFADAFRWTSAPSRMVTLSATLPPGESVLTIAASQRSPGDRCPCSFSGAEARHPVVTGLSDRSFGARLVRDDAIARDDDATITLEVDAPRWWEGYARSRKFELEDVARGRDTITRDAAADQLSVRWELLRWVLPGGPIVGVGGGLGDGSGLRLRAGYEFAAPRYAVYSLAVESDAKTHVELIPTLEGVPPWGRVLSPFPMPSLGVGAPVQVWPQTRAGVRAQLGVGWYVVTLLLSVDVYPARGAEPRLLRGGIMAQLSM